MLKWITIVGIVLAGFMVIILSLGYLLKQNEEKTTALVNQLEQEKREQQAKQQNINEPRAVIRYHDASAKAKAMLAQVTGIISGNLTCVESKQCQRVDLTFRDGECSVAVNMIGKKQLVTSSLNFDLNKQCSNTKPNATAVCLAATCQLQ